MVSKRSPFGAPDFTLFVATRVRTPIVEHRITNHGLRRQYGIGGQAISLDVTFPHIVSPGVQINQLPVVVAW